MAIQKHAHARRSWWDDDESKSEFQVRLREHLCRCGLWNKKSTSHPAEQRCFPRSHSTRSLSSRCRWTPPWRSTSPIWRFFWRTRRIIRLARTPVAARRHDDSVVTQPLFVLILHFLEKVVEFSFFHCIFGFLKWNNLVNYVGPDMARNGNKEKKDIRA